MSANTLAFERRRARTLDSRDRQDAAAPGCASLVVIRNGGRSVVSHAYATSPLRLLLPANHGPGAWVFTSTFGGGLVDGDHLSMDVEIGAGAMALLATQASTKIYRSQNGTRSEVRARIASGGLLAVLPDPIVCFAGSRYRQRQQFDLAKSASLVALDWVTAGRRAAGERWAFDEYIAKLVVTTEGRLLLHDVLALRAADGDLSSRLGRFDVMVIAIVVGAAVAADAAAIVSRVHGEPIERRAEWIAAATPIENGCVLRVAGRSLEQVAFRLRTHLAFVPALLGDDPWARKW